MQTKIRKIISLSFIMVFMSALFLTAGCGGNSSPSTKAPVDKQNRVIIDDRGKSIKIPTEVCRIVSLCKPFAEIIWTVDGTGERIVGIHPSAKVALENSMLGKLAPELKDAGTEFTEMSTFDVNVEELVKLKPDLVFQWTSKIKEIEKMEQAGITVVGVAYHKEGMEEHERVPHWLELIGKILNKEDRSSELAQYYRNTVEEITAITSTIPEDKKPVILNLRSLEQLRAFYFPWFETAGAIDPMKDATNMTTLNMEQVLTWNPDIIYISNFCDKMPEDLLKNNIKGQDWNDVKAVKNGQVYKIPLGTYRWGPPNTESSLCMWWAASIQHPELFKNYPIKQRIKDFYQKFYNYELSDKELEWILNPIPKNG